MTDRSLSNRLADLSDQLCTVSDLNEAINMAASDSTVLGSARDALQALCAVIEAKITSIKEQLEEIMEDLKP